MQKSLDFMKIFQRNFNSSSSVLLWVEAFEREKRSPDFTIGSPKYFEENCLIPELFHRVYENVRWLRGWSVSCVCDI